MTSATRLPVMRRDSATLRLVAFAAGASLMLVELVSGRALAPYLGTSFYTWTNAIATTLLGVVLGNLVGGILADRSPGDTFGTGGRRLLSFSLIVAAGSIVFSNYMIVVSHDLLGGVAIFLPVKSAFHSLLIFFPPAFLLSAIFPQLVKEEIKDINAAGRGVGSIGFWNSLGNIFGLLLGGYVLIAALGTKGLMTGLALLILILGFVLGYDFKFWKYKMALLLPMLFIGDFLVPGFCKIETNYYCVRIETVTDKDGVGGYVLRLDHLVHSYVTPALPGRLGYGYERIYAELIASRFDPAKKFSTYFIGGGGYVLPRYIENYYPEADITVGEIDPGVTKANFLFMELSPQTRIKTVNGDSRRSLERDTGVRYDLVFGDAFNDFSVPYHLTTLEFHRLLKTRMSADGIYALNIIDDGRYGKFLAAVYRTLSQVWKYVYVASLDKEPFPARRNTFVLLASDEPFDQNVWASAKSFVQADVEINTRLLSASEIAEFLIKHPQGPLTDDFVPVERYLAPVFSGAY